MSFFEAGAGLLLGLLSVALAYLAYRRGSRADVAAQETSANAQVYAGYALLVKQVQADNDDLRRKLQESDQKQDQRMTGADSVVQSKADSEYVEALEKRLDRCLARMDGAEKRLEQAEKDVEDCKKEMEEKIRVLEARLEGKAS